jgi:hypothetical protein
MVDIIFDVFDNDKSGTLENDEFISVMQVRRFHGAGRRRLPCHDISLSPPHVCVCVCVSHKYARSHTKQAVNTLKATYKVRRFHVALCRRLYHVVHIQFVHLASCVCARVRALLTMARPAGTLTWGASLGAAEAVLRTI